MLLSSSIKSVVKPDSNIKQLNDNSLKTMMSEVKKKYIGKTLYYRWKYKN